MSAGMEHFEQPWQPPAGPFRLHFRVRPPLQRDEVEPLLRELVGDVPVAPEEAELDPEGDGWLRYEADADLTIGDRDQIIAWLQAHSRLSSVRCVSGPES